MKFLLVSTILFSGVALANPSAMKSALKNTAVKAVLEKSAKEASMTVKKCTTTVDAFQDHGSETKSLKFTVNCVNGEAEIAIQTTVEGTIYGDSFMLESVVINRAG